MRVSYHSNPSESRPVIGVPQGGVAPGRWQAPGAHRGDGAGAGGEAGEGIPAGAGRGAGAIAPGGRRQSAERAPGSSAAPGSRCELQPLAGRWPSRTPCEHWSIIGRMVRWRMTFCQWGATECRSLGGG